MNQPLVIAGLGLAVLAAATTAVIGQENKKPAAPEVLGKWSGTWGPYLAPDKPEESAKAYAAYCKPMDCTIQRKGEKWQATFEGECGRPYKYTITMLGRQSGNSVMFQGSADLGEKDGGAYDWIGRVTDKEFVGFYTSRGHVGTFKLVRLKP